MKTNKNKNYKCRFCENEYNKKEKACPNCGAKSPKNTFFLFLCFMIFLIILGTFINDKISFSSIDIDNKDIKKNLKIYEYSTNTINNEYHIVGILVNNSSKDYTFIEISFNAFDINSNIIDICKSVNNGLQANSKWKFNVTCNVSGNLIKEVELNEIIHN